MKLSLQTNNSLFNSATLNTVYRGSDLLVEMFKNSMDLLLPATQILLKKQPTYKHINMWQKGRTVLMAFPGACAVLLTLPLAGVAKLVQISLLPWMHQKRLHIPKGTKFPLPFCQGEKPQLHIGSLNVIGLPNAAFMLGDKSSGDTAAKRLPLIAEALKKEDLDIICIQESFDVKGSRALASIFDDRYVLYHIGERHPFLLGSGLMMISKYPILKAHFVPYPLRLGIDKLAQKGAAMMKIDLGERDGKKVVGYVATTHAQANTKDSKQSAQVRNQQLQLLQEAFENFVKDTSLPDEEIKLKMMCGDLNFDNYRTTRAHLDRHELAQPAVQKLFKTTIDPVTDTDAAPKLDSWVRASDLPGYGTALHWKNPWAKNDKELLDEVEGTALSGRKNGSRRLDYTLFDAECHRYNQALASRVKIIRSDKGLILTDHLLTAVKVAYDSPNAPQRITRCVHQPFYMYDEKIDHEHDERIF